MPNLGSVGELFVLLKAEDQTKTGIDSAKSRMSKLSSAAKYLGAGLTALGGFLMMADERARQLGETLGRVSVKTNIAKDTLRNMVLTLSDVDFTLDDVTEGMEALTQKGIKNEQQMEKNLKRYDMVADALGLGMRQAIEDIGGALELFGYSIEDIESKQDTFAYVFQNSISGIDEFLSSLERLGVEIQESGMTLEEYTAIYLILEERGLKGRAGIKAMREAMTETYREMEKLAEKQGKTAYEFQETEQYQESYFKSLLQNLRITNVDLERHAEGIMEAAGATKKLDEVHQQSHSTLDKMKYAFDRLKFTIGSCLEPLSFLGPVLTTLGPIMMSISMASQAWATTNTTMVAPSLTAVTVAGLPLWIILGAIAAAALALILVFKNWGKISDWLKRQLSKISSAFSALKNKLGGIKQKIKDKLGGIKETFTNFVGESSERLGGFKTFLETALLGPFALIKKPWEENWWGIRDTLTNVYNQMKEKVSNGMAAIKDLTISKIESIIDFLKTLPEKMYKHVSDALQKIIDAIKDKLSDIKAAVSDVIGKLNPLNWDIPGLSPFLSAFEHAGRLGIDSLMKGITAEIPQLNISPTIAINPEIPKLQTITETHINQTQTRTAARSTTATGSTTVTIHVDNLTVRDQSDIEQIARKLAEHLKVQKAKRKG